MPDAEAKKSITLSRDELYALVWATPMSRLAAGGIAGDPPGHASAGDDLAQAAGITAAPVADSRRALPQPDG
ncbi:hypothetical protein [Bradyrhizobium brasilense]|uniref:hypothetical protein n=1 Tax=Bradyrhizobium brasilense TaxID=1419277 RepID=UPI001E4D7F4C|nr:hypothetical protein [Bradyrhizobium brasilense]MCC8968905.1 hypothetical protein [Bradyrhizobium brasilense]